MDNSILNMVLAHDVKPAPQRSLLTCAACYAFFLTNNPKQRSCGPACTKALRPSKKNTAAPEQVRLQSPAAHEYVQEALARLRGESVAVPPPLPIRKIGDELIVIESELAQSLFGPEITGAGRRFPWKSQMMSTITRQHYVQNTRRLLQMRLTPDASQTREWVISAQSLDHALPNLLHQVGAFDHIPSDLRQAGTYAWLCAHALSRLCPLVKPYESKP